ncbi:mycofactocin-coupled SDR family oxidoreductase [Microbacterium sp. RD1]|uniref:mycofactocin-coupled SDR family oxidoreductase n=1 Tax=Microbacterium sp. RD1 TaxID=3457313 RepID=UPI003FA614B3
MGRVEGRVAFITGAGRGQGRAHAVRLAEEGADIVALDILEDAEGVPYRMSTLEDRDETIAAVEATGRRILFEKADTRDLAALQRVAALGVEQFGSIDIVVANAAATGPAVSYEMSEEAFVDTIDRCLTSSWRTVRATAPHMIEAGRGGSIILTSSIAGLVAIPNLAHYTAAKHGVSGLMKAFAVELGPFDIRVNAIASSNVRTPMIDNAAIRGNWTGNPSATDDEVRRTMSAMHILDVPWAEPVDIAQAVLWLASDESRYVTGSTIPVDAGALAPFTIPHAS